LIFHGSRSETSVSGRIQQNSEKNQDKIEIEVSINRDDFVVYVFMPKEIDGNTLEAAYFYKGISYFEATKDDYDFSMPLEILEDEKRQAFTYFTIKKPYTP